MFEGRGLGDRLRFHVERRTLLLATRPGLGGRPTIVWRWRARKLIRVIGVSRGVLVVYEELVSDRGGGPGVDARLLGLDAGSGRVRWQRVYEGIAPAPEAVKIEGRLLTLYAPNGVYATGHSIYIAAETGREVLRTDLPLERRTPHAIVWLSQPGPTPWGSGTNIVVQRLDLRTLERTLLRFPLPTEGGVEYGDIPTGEVRLRGDILEAECNGYRNRLTEAVSFTARWRLSAGQNQKPEIITFSTSPISNPPAATGAP